MYPEAKSKEGFAHEPRTPKLANKTPMTSEITGEDIRSFKLLIASAMIATANIKKIP